LLTRTTVVTKVCVTCLYSVRYGRTGTDGECRLSAQPQCLSAAPRCLSAAPWHRTRFAPRQRGSPAPPTCLKLPSAQTCQRFLCLRSALVPAAVTANLRLRFKYLANTGFGYFLRWVDRGSASAFSFGCGRKAVIIMIVCFSAPVYGFTPNWSAPVVCVRAGVAGIARNPATRNHSENKDSKRACDHRIAGFSLLR